MATSKAANPAEAGCTHRPLIDVHHHIIPPFYLQENHDRIAGSRGGAITPAWLEWTPEKALTAMDEHQVATSVLSLSSPGVWFGDAQMAKSTARRSNEYAAELGRQHPGRFGLFAALPLPDTESSLLEIKYAFDVLKADGIGLLTSYGDKWLGDTAYEPVFEELDRRKAVVFIHPTTPTCCQTLMPGVATVVAEVPHDTTRTIVSMLYAGTLARFPNIRFILSHAGGTLPVVAGRIIDYAPPRLAKSAPNGVLHELKRLYYDLAISGNGPAFAALAQLVPMSQILFGSDHPYQHLKKSVHGIANFDLSEADLRAIGWENALALLPHLQTNVAS